MVKDYVVKKVPHDVRPESHIHEFYEIFIPLSSDGTFFVGAQPYALQLGSCFIMKPLELHYCRGYNRYVVHVTQAWLRKLSTEKTDLVALFDSAPPMINLTDDLLSALLSKLSYLSKPVPDAFGADVRHDIYFNLFLIMIGEYICSHSDFSPVHTKRDSRVACMIEYIHEHYAEDISLDELCRRFFISKSRLSQIFKDYTGFSVGNYIIIYRIKRACILLSEGESVKNVCVRVGFNNNTHFIRLFKKYMGCSPGRFAANDSNETEEKNGGF